MPGDGAALFDDPPPAEDALGLTGAEVRTEAAAAAVDARMLDSEAAGPAAAAA